MDIKPIETVYNGYRFRSRLEARWAVFFDAAGIEYEYEPEGFHTKSGINYLPDFYLPEDEFYVEVKPNRPGADKEIKDAIMATCFNEKTLLVLREIPYDKECNLWWFPVYYLHPITRDITGCRVTILGDDTGCYFERNLYDGMKAQLAFPFGVHGIKDCIAINDTELNQSDDFPCRDAFEYSGVSNCLLVARQARFEHGETPRIRR